MKRKIYIISLLLIIGLVFLGGKAMMKTEDVGLFRQWLNYIKVSLMSKKDFQKSLVIAEQFVRLEFIMEDGGIRTKFKEEDYTVDYATGNEVLSESVGLLMRYAVKIDDEKLFKQLLNYTEKKLLVENVISYRFSDVFGVFEMNAVIDDLRIIRALYEAGEAFANPIYTNTANIYAGKLYITNVSGDSTSGNQLIDFYDTKYQYQNDYLTLCYADFQTISEMSEDDTRWTAVYKETLDIVQGGYIGEEFPFYASSYNYKSQTYDKSKIVTNQSILTMIHLAEIGHDLEQSIEFIKKLVRDQSLYILYDQDGQPLDYNHSTANYALAAILGSVIGDKDLQYEALTEMKQFQVEDRASPVFGGFADIETNESYSFDNLNALLALQTMQSVSRTK